MKKIFSNLFSYLKPGDLVLVALLFGLSFFPLITSFSTSQTTATLKVDGQTIKTFPLKKQQHYTYHYQAADGHSNIIEVKDQKVRIKHASCTDQRCVKQGWITKHQTSIVCLPHRLVLEIGGIK